MEKKMRSSNLELLRIVSMFFIVSSHFGVHGGFNLMEKPFIINKIIVQLNSAGKFGVNLFVLITGYFLITGKFSLKKLINLMFETWFYSIFIMLIFLIFPLGINVGIKSVIKSCLPIIYSSYWFITTYIILYIFVPFINSFINKISQKEYLKLLFLLIMFCSFIPTFTKATFAFSDLSYFLLLYLVGGYIRLYPNKYTEKTVLNFLYGIVFYLLICISIIVFDALGEKYQIFSRGATYFFGQQSFPLFISSVGIFLGFKNLKIKNIKIINMISSTTLGIYLIHDNFFVREFLWLKFFKVSEHFYDKYLLFYSLKIILLVFFVCMIIDFIRQILFKYTINIFLEKYFDKIFIYLKNNINKFLKILKQNF